MSKNQQDDRLRADDVLSEQKVAEVDEQVHLPLDEQARVILAANDRGNYTVPAEGLYPHQWLWDSCFIAIGLRHIDVDRAQSELLSLIEGQWSNGMLPNMIFNSAPEYSRDRNFWRSCINPHSPDGIATSGVTQPPMLAEAVWQVGQKLKLAERRGWYKRMLPPIIAYHNWLYRDRDPHNEGLVLLLHPWETGLDNTPPWTHELHEHLMPTWIRFIRWAHLDGLVGFFRRDRHYIPPGQRLSTLETLSYFNAQRRLRRKGYDTMKILDRSLFAIEDLTFNCIFIRANQRLCEMAKTIRYDLPDELMASMKKTEKALLELYDPYSSTYWSRDFITHRLLKQPSIAALMPLYAGVMPKEHAEQVVRKLENEHIFGPAFPVPSAPLDSPVFDPDRYWQGPSWVNTNWLIIDGLHRAGFNDHAEALTDTTLDMVRTGGFAEYFHPISGEGLGARNFSWTAALVLDLLTRQS
ncbi:glycoside hydrolase [Candidatus Saccharibacteria bacterium]|nr:MAG: glycoside hydrolase [Candidatus Saccharibacteria bacterium]PID99229.1 MAG: glycoside hydrolase [Candidatus Saccharibacteria bacterium]